MSAHLGLEQQGIDVQMSKVPISGSQYGKGFGS